jgi:ABC-2 type transport system permease protein
MKLAYYIAIRLWKQLLRDRRTLALMVIGPVVYIVIFGFAFGGEIENIPVCIINNDSDAQVTIPLVGSLNVPSIGENIVSGLDESEVTIITEMTNFTYAKELVINKEYFAAIYIPTNFTYNLASPIGSLTSIELYLDNSNPQIGASIAQALQTAFQDAAAGFKSNFKFSIGYAYGEDLRTIDYFAPAVIGLGVFFFSFILIEMNLIDERRKGTLPLLLQCPFDKGDIILGYLAAFSILSMIQTTLIIIMANLLYGVSFGTGILQFISLYIVAVVMGWISLVLGLFLSSFARTEFQAVQFIPLVLFPVFFLSGIIIPLIQIPEAIRWISYLIPITYGIHLLQQIAIEGYILEPFNSDFIAMILFFLLFLIGSRLSLKET